MNSKTITIQGFVVSQRSVETMKPCIVILKMMKQAPVPMFPRLNGGVGSMR